MWVFYHKSEGHTIWYYIAVIFKAIFGDLQGFFTSLIYFYFNTEIRYEVLRQVQRTLLSNDTVRRSSVGDTLSTRLSVFRISFSRHRHSSIPNRNEKRRTRQSSFSPPANLKTRQICWRKCLTFLCPCLFNRNRTLKQEQELHQLPINEIIQQQQHETIPVIISSPSPDDDLPGITSPLLTHTRPSKGTIDNDGTTCDTLIVKNGIEDEILSDENDVTIHQSSYTGEHASSISSNHTPLLPRNHIPNHHHHQSNSDEHAEADLATKDFDDNKSLR